MSYNIMIYRVSNNAVFNDLDFKVTPFFDAEYLRNGTTYRHSVIEILIWTTVLVRMTLSDLSDLAKYSMKYVTQRSLDVTFINKNLAIIINNNNNGFV